MLVQQILKTKAVGGVFTVEPGVSVREAAEVLASKRIGGVVVSSDGETPEGILSERDIVRTLATQGPSCLDQKVSALMTPDPKCCQPEDSVESVLRRMTDGRFRHMPVTEGGKLVGIVTIGDAVAARLSQLAMEKDALEGMIMGH
ncbi:CBS domain-containing protein [Pseudooceanicola sp. 502str34]